MVLDHQHRVPGIDQPVEHAAQGSHVVQVQAGGWLVQDVKFATTGAAFRTARQRQLARDLETLCLAAGERRRWLA